MNFVMGRSPAKTNRIAEFADSKEWFAFWRIALNTTACHDQNRCIPLN